MTFQEFIATRQQSNDLRQFPDSPYGANNNEAGEPSHPIDGYAYCGGDYAIQRLPEGGFRAFIQFEQDFRDLASAELELFYYHGRFAGQTFRPTFWDRLEMACRTSDLDAACRYIQDGLGQDDGGAAGMFFSAEERGNEAFAVMPHRVRYLLLCDYIREELSEVDARLSDPEASPFVDQAQPESVA